MMDRKQFIRATLASLGTALLFGGVNGLPAVSQNIDLEAFRNTVLTEHNFYRSIHHSPDLTLSSSLNQAAQAHAEDMLSRGELFHSSGDPRNAPGENLFFAYTYPGSPIPPEVLAVQALESWYEEVDNYYYENPGFSADTGHFTQVVWKDTTQLGCGIAEGPASIGGQNLVAYYVACQYTSPGNVHGGYSSNVLQP